MSVVVARFLIPFDNIGYELRPSATARGILRKVKKITNETMGWDPTQLRKEVDDMTEKLSEKKKYLQHLLQQQKRSSKTAVAYHAAKNFVKSVIGRKKRDVKHPQDEHSADKEGPDNDAQSPRTVPGKYDPDVNTPKSQNDKAGPHKKSLFSRIKSAATSKMARARPKSKAAHGKTPSNAGHVAAGKSQKTAKAKGGSWLRKSAKFFQGKKKK